MDHARLAQYGFDATQFLDLTGQIVSAVESATTTSSQVKFAEEWRSKLLDVAEKVKFAPSNDVSLISQEDEILITISRDCEKASSLLLTDLKTSTPWKSQNSLGSDLAVLRQSIGYAINVRLSVLLWTSLVQEIRELGAKNSRLDANRTEDIKSMLERIDSLFGGAKGNDDKPALRPDNWSEIQAMAVQAREYSIEQHLLSGSLHFWLMDRRKDSLPESHEKTFSWMLSETNSQNTSKTPVNFVEWLKSSEKIYWISGKPGCGKSTLMKYIAENPKTIQELRHWAADDRLITANFYFWSSAKDPLQKSDTGLLRSILFQILRQCPELIRHGFSEQWEDALSGVSRQRYAKSDLTTPELLSVFQRISARLASTKVKFCFFLDGLDEFDGEPNDIIRLIDSLSQTENLKACISSRPWKQFEDMFGGRNPWKLYVHDLTANDMRFYVEDLLTKDNRIRRLKAADEDEASTLVDNIVRNSEGVFLWVFLVVRSLISGLQNSDGITELRKKLAAMPSDLDQYFDKMLLEIDPSTRQKTAHVFEVTLQATEKLPLLCYWFCEEENLESVKIMQVRPFSEDTARRYLEQITERLSASTKGLLKASGLDQDDGLPLILKPQQWLFEFRVDFLHRTVADFFRTGNMRRLLAKWSSPSLDVDDQICVGCLAILKATPSTDMMFSEAPKALSVLHLFLSHVKALELRKQRDFLDTLTSCLKTHDKKIGQIMPNILGPGNYWSFDSDFEFAVLYLFVSYGLGEYVRVQIDSEEHRFSEPTAALLTGCFSWDYRVRVGRFSFDSKNAELLLRKGLDPNVQWGDRNFSFWQSLLNTAYSNHLKGTLTQADRDAVRLALDHAANPKATLEIHVNRKLQETAATKILEKILPREQYVVLRFHDANV